MFKKSLNILFSLFLASSLVIIPTVSANFSSTFPDVALTNKYYSHINNLKENTIVNGYTNGNFGPENSLTRGEMSKFVKNAIFGKTYENLSCSNFPDVSSGSDTFYKETTTLKCEGVVNGYPDGSFKSNLNVNRGEATKFVVNSVKKKLINTDFASADEMFVRSNSLPSDVPQNQTFNQFIDVVYAYELMSVEFNSKYENKFVPEGFINRQEMAELIWNSMMVVNNYNKTPQITIQKSGETSYESYYYCTSKPLTTYNLLSEGYKVEDNLVEGYYFSKNNLLPKEFRDTLVDFDKVLQGNFSANLDSIRHILAYGCLITNTKNTANEVFIVDIKDANPTGFDSVKVFYTYSSYGIYGSLRLNYFAKKGDSVLYTTNSLFKSFESELTTYQQECSSVRGDVNCVINKIKNNPTILNQLNLRAKAISQEISVNN